MLENVNLVSFQFIIPNPTVVLTEMKKYKFS